MELEFFVNYLDVNIKIAFCVECLATGSASAAVDIRVDRALVCHQVCLLTEAFVTVLTNMSDLLVK